LTDLTNLVYCLDMDDTMLATIDFSSAKAGLSDLMTDVFHQHRAHVVSRHRGKEQMLLVRPADLLEWLPNEPLDVRAVYDAGEVTLSIPDMGVLGFGNSLEEAERSLLGNLRSYAARFFENPARYGATKRRAHAPALLRFALADEAGQRALLGQGMAAPSRELVTTR
jgi:hypothetical protein